MNAPNCLVVAERFPNIYESYILNQIEFLLKSGAEVKVFSGPPLGRRFDERIDRYGLRCRNFSYAFNSVPEALAAIRPFFSLTYKQCHPYQGVRKLLESGYWSQLNLKDKIKALLKSPILGSTTKFDLVHAHRFGLAYENLFLSEALQVPLVVSFHGLQTLDMSRPFFLSEEATNKLFGKIKLVTAGTEYAKRILVHLGCPLEKIRIVPVGIHLEHFPFCPTVFSSDRKIVLLTVARLSLEKGHEYAIAAVRVLREKGWNVEYRIVGDGPLNTHLQTLARSLGVSDYIVFTGEKENDGLRAEYRDADIFLLPSTNEANNELKGETQGLAIQEAQASGKLVVATRIGGIAECVDSEHSVLLVPERSPDALANSLERLLVNGQEWDSRQRAGRAWVERRFSMDVLGQRLVDVYEEAMQ